jgi:quercetin dioxygenase-like cupin family protein
MTTFYDEWLGAWDQSEGERRQARHSIHPHELDWVETQNDHRAALLISPQTGFRTWGTTTMITEIPAGMRSGAHKHGEEAIYVLDGQGFSIIDGVKYEWKKGSVLAIPFGAVHEHVNTGPGTVRYVSALTVDLERFVGIHRTVQVREKGEAEGDGNAPTSLDGKAPDGTRILLHREQGRVRKSQETAKLDALPSFDPEHPLVVGDGDGMNRVIPIESHNAMTIDFMRNRLKRNSELNDFSITSAEISGILVNAPHEYGGMHAHMEAHLYILDGHGYTIIGDDKVSWSKGSAIQVPGPQTPHRHVNASDVPSEMLRIAYGIRYYFEGFAKREFPYLYLAMRQGYENGNDGTLDVTATDPNSEAARG